MVLRPVKIALFIAIAINAVVLIKAREFYWDTQPGLPYKIDICSGTGDEDYYHLAAAVGLFAGVPASVGSLTQSVTQRSRLSACLAVVAFILNLLPYWLGKTLDAYVIRIHASQVSQNCGE